MNEHTANPSPTPSTGGPSRRQRLGRLLLGAIFLVSTGLAFTLVYLTEDRMLDANQRRARTDIRRLEGLFKSHHRLMGHFPSKEEGFTPLIQARLLERVPVDPWGHPYVYWMNGQAGAVVSYGADGKPGGTGPDADLSSGGVLAAGWDQP